MSEEKGTALSAWCEGQEWTEAHKAKVLQDLLDQRAALCPSLKNNSLHAISSGFKSMEDAAMEEAEVANGLIINKHTQRDCAQIQRMIEALEDGSFNGECISCKEVIPPERVALCASFQCVNCAILEECRQKTKDAFKSAYQGGVYHV